MSLQVNYVPSAALKATHIGSRLIMKCNRELQATITRFGTGDTHGWIFFTFDDGLNQMCHINIIEDIYEIVK